jgi:gliding motility-associated-like protein
MHRLRRYIFCTLSLLPFSAIGQVPGFTMPDTVCINSPVAITNTSTGGSTWYWNFCMADLKQTPQGVNFGNIGGLFSQPVYIDICSQGGNYYGLLVNHYPGGLIRLDFGNSLLNTPVATYLGNFGGIINAGYGSEGIQVANANGNWTALIIGGNPVSGSTPRLVKVDFGPDITNPSPVATNWGDLGNTDQAIDLYLFREGTNWHAYTVSAVTNAIVRYDFGADFTTPPTAVNLGNPGNSLNYPTGICPVNDGGNWRLFITNGSIPASLIRLDFGNSLLNTPTVVPLGNPQNVLTSARSIRILQLCDQVIGFVTDGTANTLVQLDFHNDLTSIPDATNLGNLANFNFPHSLSKLFRVGADLYSFIPNAYNNTLSRIKFEGCTSSSIPNSIAFSPPPVSYAQPGTYHVNLIMDDGLPTQNSFCRTITVLAPPVFSLGNDTTLCSSSSLTLSAPLAPDLQYLWQDGSTADKYTVGVSGEYRLTVVRAGVCLAKDSIRVRMRDPDSFGITPENPAVCAGDTAYLKITGGDGTAGDHYTWTPGGDTPDPVLMVDPDKPTTYQVIAYDNLCGLQTPLAATVTIRPPPVTTVSRSNDIDCLLGETQLLATGGADYSWSPASTLSDPTLPAPIARTDTTTVYQVKITGYNGCRVIDTIRVSVSKTGSIGFPLANAFTPNGDGNNDCYGIKYWGYIGHFQMSIFNRSGQQVFYSENPGECWDGNYKGRAQPAGAYICVIKAATLCGIATKKAPIYLVR